MRALPLLMLACLAAPASASQPQPPLPPPAPSTYAVEQRTADLHFSYEWPAAAEDIPALASLLRQRMNADYAQALAGLEEDRRGKAASGIQPMPHTHDLMWMVEGDTPDLLSLLSVLDSFSGGNHPNVTHEALLWDRAAGRPVTPASVLGEGALAALRARFCTALAADYADRLGDADNGGSDTPLPCPPLENAVLVLEDRDGDGRFDMLTVPYSPAYAAGFFVPEIYFERADLARVPARYRASFEVMGEAD